MWAGQKKDKHKELDMDNENINLRAGKENVKEQENTILRLTRSENDRIVKEQR